MYKDRPLDEEMMGHCPALDKTDCIGLIEIVNSHYNRDTRTPPVEGDLFKHIFENHRLMLTESELENIKTLCRKEFMEEAVMIVEGFFKKFGNPNYYSLADISKRRLVTELIKALREE